MNLKYQKYCIISLLLMGNTILSSTFIIYKDYWYAYLFVLALASFINSFSCLFNLGHKMLYEGSNNNNRLRKKNYVYVVPCYTESKQELLKTLSSLVLQREVKRDVRAIIIICDGTSANKNNICDKVLKDLLDLQEDDNGQNESQVFSYPTWDHKENLIQVYKGHYSFMDETLPVILLIKMENYGKRDSLVLLRQFCYNYNESLLGKNIPIDNNPLTAEMLYNLNLIYSGEPIDYIIGIDADTEFDYNCSYELIQGIEADKDIHGCVGYVDIAPESDFLTSPFILYQYAEYMFAQCLKRQAQSRITQKVNCLSGCVQILRVSKETCGEEILAKFNYLPAAEESIFNHIRSYASEDRNHVCHLLSMYPYVKTTQNLKAIAYTTVPTTWQVFLSQRRRWSLGANSNDMLLITLPGILFVERISSFVNVCTYSCSPFIFIATILFLKAIFTEPTILMLYLCTIIFLPLFYALFIVPIFIRPLCFRQTFYYYLSYIFFYIISSLVNLVIFFYSISCMDVIKWGKTRQIRVAVEGVTEAETETDYTYDDYIYDEIVHAPVEQEPVSLRQEPLYVEYINDIV
jgi:chitin synthase